MLWIGSRVNPWRAINSKTAGLGFIESGHERDNEKYNMSHTQLAPAKAVFSTLKSIGVIDPEGQKKERFEIKFWVLFYFLTYFEERCIIQDRYFLIFHQTTLNAADFEHSRVLAFTKDSGFGP